MSRSTTEEQTSSNHPVILMSTPVHYIYRIIPGFVPFSEQKIQGLFKDIIQISQGQHSVQKRALSLCLFSALPHLEEFYPEGLSVFTPFPLQFPLNYKVRNEISRTSQRRLQFSRTFNASNFYFKFKDFQKDFQRACEQRQSFNICCITVFSSRRYSLVALHRSLQ